jgi:predicted exporter
MALRQDIEAIRDLAIMRLNDAHDYVTYTKATWRALQRAVRQDGLKFSWRNVSTSSLVSEQDLLARAQRYVAEELASSTLQQFVSIFESFLFDALRAWLLTYPAALSKANSRARTSLASLTKPQLLMHSLRRSSRTSSMIVRQTGSCI